MDKKKILLIIIFQVIIFSSVGYFRYIDIDEGYYLNAAKLVTEGKLPYLDFFYTQMPLLPYFYGNWMRIFGFNFFSARVLSIIAAMLANLFLIIYAYKKTKSRQVAIIAAMLFIFNGQLISWFTTAKTYSLTMLFLLAAFILLTEFKKINIFLAGLFLSLAINTRLIFLPMVAVLLIWIFIRQARQGLIQAARGAFIFTAGVIPPSLLSLYLFIKNPGNFFFDNFTSHLKPPGLNLSHIILLKLQLLFHLISRPQFFLLFIASVGSVLILVRKILKGDGINKHKDEILAALFFLGVFIVTCCLPWECEQYFVMCVPFLIILSYKFIQETMLQKANILYQLLVVLFGLYIIFSLPSTGLMGGLLISPDRDDWASRRNFTRGYIEKVSQKVKEVTQAGDIVLSWWPGDVFWAGRNNFPGMENEFGYFYASDKIPRELAKQYRIATDSDLIDAIKNNIPKAVIFNYSYPFQERRRSLEKHLKDNYLPLERIGQTIIYLSKKK